ncbi:hypothetical protein GCM10008955_38190 [Deinococcus malanensis]|uniref:Uncharacterized protein n=1 Tax=Deinococcus malanensis TaxID=1706855 RepID=A0ABQ2F4D4_9DEIO|nr:hypothetical protein [Deinococcus malanensis]GGK40804.1 hypothetical protein GCM10008955_38190 [Deinococcus malanensis]
MFKRKISFVGAGIFTAAMVIIPTTRTDTMANGCVGAFLSLSAHATQETFGMGLGKYAQTYSGKFGQGIHRLNEAMCKAL